LDYTAFDFSPIMLERARAKASSRHLEYIRFERGDAAALPYGDGSFDLVLCFNGLHCMPDPGTALSEMVRVLRSGGQLWASWLVQGQDPAADLWIRFLQKRQYLDVCPREDDAMELFEGLNLRSIRTTKSGSYWFVDGTKSM
jgi:ubiquinone/menaquinone biosynthesis C-methylase UbiE